MLEFHAFDDHDRIITEYDPFCWLIWPFEIAIIALETIKTSVALTHSDSAVKVEGFHSKETYVPRGAAGGMERHQVIEISSLAPFTSRTRYEDRGDYLDARRRIKDQGFVFLGVKITIDKPK